MSIAARSSEILSIRVSAEERAVLEAAATNSHAKLSEFVRRAALEAAEIEMMSRRVVTIPASRWDEFEAWLRRPPAENSGLAALARRVPVWERGA